MHANGTGKPDETQKEVKENSVLFRMGYFPHCSRLLLISYSQISLIAALIFGEK
jgi:hypothetical protein